MRHDLVPEEVEIDPISTRSALFAFQNAAIKRTRFIKIANGKGKMKAGPGAHRMQCLAWRRGSASHTGQRENTWRRLGRQKNAKPQRRAISRGANCCASMDGRWKSRCA